MRPLPLVTLAALLAAGAALAQGTIATMRQGTPLDQNAPAAADPLGRSTPTSARCATGPSSRR